MCGKLSELLVKSFLSCGQPNYEFLQYFLLWVGPIDDVRMRTMRVASIALSVVCKLQRFAEFLQLQKKRKAILSRFSFDLSNTEHAQYRFSLF